MKKPKLAISTINVVETFGGEIQGIVSFPYNDEGVKAAEALFRKTVFEEFPDTARDEMSLYTLQGTSDPDRQSSKTVILLVYSE